MPQIFCTHNVQFKKKIFIHCFLHGDVFVQISQQNMAYHINKPFILISHRISYNLHTIA